MVNITFILWVNKHFVIEQITIRAKGSKSWKWECKRGALKMHVCVGWCVKWNSLWPYTMLPSYDFTEWMISMIVTVRLWRHFNIVRIRLDLWIHTLNWKCHLLNKVKVGTKSFINIYAWMTLTMIKLWCCFSCEKLLLLILEGA